MNYLLRTSEIILKGKNRKFFENILIANIKKSLKDDLISIKNLGGLFWVQTKKETEFKNILGITNYSKVEIFSNLKEVFYFLKKNLKLVGKSFKVEVQRGDKDYPLNSLEIEKQIADFIKDNLKMNLDFKNPDIIIYLYYKAKKFFLYFEKIEGFDGLPVSSSGKGLSLLSAGFDSPVASFLMMKRGMKIYFVHFHSYPQTSKDSLEKVKKVVEILNNYNLDSKLYLMNILDIQKFYFQNLPPKFLVIFYRRTMFRLAEKLALDLNLDALITGESLGQVASQTIENLRVIEEGLKLPVLRPLIGLNKTEIMNLSKKIGTFEISSLPGDDCCSLFIPRKVETKAKLEEVSEIEEKFKKEIENLEKKIYQSKDIISMKN